jgi:hypothetical protein
MKNLRIKFLKDTLLECWQNDMRPTYPLGIAGTGLTVTIPKGEYDCEIGTSNTRSPLLIASSDFGIRISRAFQRFGAGYLYDEIVLLNARGERISHRDYPEFTLDALESRIKTGYLKEEDSGYKKYLEYTAEFGLTPVEPKKKRAVWNNDVWATFNINDWNNYGAAINQYNYTYNTRTE